MRSPVRRLSARSCKFRCRQNRSGPGSVSFQLALYLIGQIPGDVGVSVIDVVGRNVTALPNHAIAAGEDIGDGSFVA